MSTKFLDASSIGALHKVVTEDIHAVVTKTIAPDYDPNRAYTVGDAVYYKDSVYVCISDIAAPEEWDAAHWQRGLAQISIQNEGQADLIINGYFFGGVFWEEPQHINRIIDRCDKLYRDVVGKGVYLYNREEQAYLQLIVIADSVDAGIMKLYSSKGNNTDGTMTQKAITDLLATKVGIDASHVTTDERLDIIVD